MSSNKNHIFDALLELKDAGAITSSAAAQVGGSAKIIDLGSVSATGATDTTVADLLDANLVLIINSLDVASTDEVYELVLQGSSSATFASDIVELSVTRLAAGAALTGAATVAGAAGRIIVPVRNERNGVAYNYLRMYTVVAGTSPSINYEAFLSKR